MRLKLSICPRLLCGLRFGSRASSASPTMAEKNAKTLCARKSMSGSRLCSRESPPRSCRGYEVCGRLEGARGRMVQVVQIVQAVQKVQTRFVPIVLVAVVCVFSDARSILAQAPADKVVVSYPSKSITNFPILETAKQKGFFQKEALNVSVVYMRGGIDIKALLTGDADFGTGSTTAVTAFVAGAPLRVSMSLNAYVDQGLYAQPKYRGLAQLKGQSVGSLNPGGLVDTLLRRILIQGGLQPERDVVILNMGGTPERYAALKSGSIAASMLSAPHSLRAEKEGFTKLA